MSGSKPVFLDVDSSIVENNLRITESEDDFSKIFGSMDKEYPSKLVKPHPGFCVKTKDQNNTKIFVNICTTDSIPPPRDISESELLQIVDTDEGSDFRIPMSIGEIRTEKDKKGEEAKACDIAIHPTFLKKVEQKQPFKNFFLAVVFQGLENKYGIVCEEEKRILANKKCFGTLQMHRIQQREIAEKMGKIHQNQNKSTMEELTGEKEKQKKVVIETISSQEYKAKEPEYRIYKKSVGPNCIIGEFKFPDILSAKELTLDIGEDRIILESKSKGYLVDVFVPYCIRNAKCSSSFNKVSKCSYPSDNDVAAKDLTMMSDVEVTPEESLCYLHGLTTFDSIINKHDSRVHSDMMDTKQHRMGESIDICRSFA